MAKKSVVFILLAFAALALVFQNCANPAPHKAHGSSNSSTSTTPGDNTTPGLIRNEDMGDFTDLGMGPTVYSSIQVSGTGEFEKLFGLRRLSDGSFIATGFVMPTATSPDSAKDILFKKFDSNGQLLYSRVIGNSVENNSFKTVETPDAYVVAGFTRSSNSRRNDVILIRLQKNNGDVIETFRYGSAAGETLYDIIPANDSDGPVMLAVGSYFDPATGRTSPFIIKFNYLFEIIWANRYSMTNNAGTPADASDDFQEDFTLRSVSMVRGSYVAVGYRTGQSRDAFIMKITTAGILIQSAKANTPGADDFFNDVTYDGSQITAVGRTSFAGRNDEGLVQKFDENLNAVSTHLIGANGSYEEIRDVTLLRDGSLVLTGITNLNNDQDNFVTRVAPDYSILFNRIFGATGTGDDNGRHSLIGRPEGGFAFIANMGSNGSRNPALMLLNQSGDYPSGCGYRRGTTNLITSSLATNYPWSNSSLYATTLSLSLATDPINLNVTDDTPGVDVTCTSN